MDTRNLRQRLLQMVTTVALVGTLGGVAHAADFCITYDSVLPAERGFFVGKGFRVPAPGKCRAFMGFSVVLGQSDYTDVTGSACTASNGATVRFTLVSNARSVFADGAWFTHVTLPLPLGTAGGYGTANTIPGPNPLFFADGSSCSGIPIP